MIKQSLLIQRNTSTGEVIRKQLLFDKDSEHTIIENIPEIEAKEGFKGEYVVNLDNTVSVKYIEIEVDDLVARRLEQIETAIGVIATEQAKQKLAKE